MSSVLLHLAAILWRWADASRVDAREDLQHFDLDTGVVADGGEPERHTRRLGLHLGVLRVGLPHLRDPPVDGHQVQAARGQELSIFALFARIARGNDQAAPNPTVLWLPSCP